jgi:hypothetical protein
MAGEPAAASLSEARLVASSCADYRAVARERAKAQIVAMRAALRDSYREWHDEQPRCWAEDRERARERESSYSCSGGVCTSYGAGGAIGFGSISLAGAGVGVGYGSGGFGGATVSGRTAVVHRASGTNNQVAGVDEADLVKTDGRYVYIVSHGALRILDGASARAVSVTRLPGRARELFVEGDRAVVYTSKGAASKPCTYGYDCAFAGDGSSTHIEVLDVTSRVAPKRVRQIDLSGSLMAARRIGSTVHTVVADGDAPDQAYATWPDNLETCGTPEKTVRARFAELEAENEQHILANTWTPTIRDRGVETPLCGGMLRTRIPDGTAVTTVVSFDLRDDDAPATTASVESRPGAVFASADALYLSVVHRKPSGRGRWYSFYDDVDEVSEIHKFHLGASPKETHYLGSGVVPGHVLNSFAMDEWYGYLRVATTRGRVPSPNVSSAVSILAEGERHDLVRVGAVSGIAPGEDIRAVRFDDDRGYVVTFKKTDPLFVLDLREPSRPSILGELKIPGFSTYLHRIDPDHLLSIGFDANDHGSFAYFDGVILQLFDVHDPTRPTLLHKEKIGTRGSSSEAATDHLAFNWYSERGLLAVPMTVCEGGGDGRNGDVVGFSGLLVYRVGVESGFEKLGGIDHGARGARCDTWWSQAKSAVKRSVFFDDLVYSIAEDRVKVQRLGHFGEDVADLALTP